MTELSKNDLLARLAIVAEKVDNIVTDNDGVTPKMVYDLTGLETDIHNDSCSGPRTCIHRGHFLFVNNFMFNNYPS